MTKDEHRSTTRVLSILSALSNTPEGLTLAELSQQLSAPKSSLFPIIHTMAAHNFAYAMKQILLKSNFPRILRLQMTSTDFLWYIIRIHLRIYRN